MSNSQTKKAMELLAELYLTPGDSGGSTNDHADRADTTSHLDPSPIPIQSYHAGTLDDFASPSLTAAGVEQREVSVTAAVLGHLPGYASPWISQYAHHAAVEHGGALLLRVTEGAVEIELFEGDAAETSSRMADEPAANRDLPLNRVVEKALEQVGAVIWMISDPAAGACGVTMGDVPRWTLLSGTDDAAVVGAYRLLKALVARVEGRLPLRGVGVMWMGAGEDEALGALDRLKRAAGSHLRMPLRLEGWRERMAPVRRRSLGRFEIEQNSEAWERAVDLLNDVAFAGDGGIEEDNFGDVTLTAEELEALTGDGPLDGSFDRDEPDESVPQMPEPQVTASIDRVAPLQRKTEPLKAIEPSAVPARSQAPAEAMTETVSGSSGGAVEAASFESESVGVSAGPTVAASIPSSGGDRAVRERDSSAGSSGVLDTGGADVGGADVGGADNLSVYIEGAMGTAARCPRHPDVQLAVGGDGRLLLLAHAEGEGVLPSVQELMEVRAWAEEHRMLLALACQDRQLRGDAVPAVHLFTDKPKAALSMAASGKPDDPTLALHLLKPIVVGGQRMYLHERLN